MTSQDEFSHNISMREKLEEYLKRYKIGKTPTQIGLGLGIPYSRASSNVNNALQRLVAKGLVSRTERPKRVVLYKWEN